MDTILYILYYIIPFIVLLGILVFVHEFGHFIIARLVGVKVSTFSIGFGKQLCSHTDKHGTNWKIGAIPLGGYCQFLGDADAASSSSEDEVLESLSEEDRKHAFQTQSSWKKLAIVLAGPAFNYLFAIIVFSALFYSYGKIVYPPVVGAVLENGAAAKAGILAGDKIVKINGNDTIDFQDISNEVNLAENNTVLVEVERNVTMSVQAENIQVDGKNSPFKMIGVGSCSINACNGVAKLPNLVQITRVIEGSPADRAGFLAGDILLSVNGIEINDFEILRSYVAEHQDETFELNIRRPLTFNISLENTEFDAGNGVKQKRKMLGIQSTTDINFTNTNTGFWESVKQGTSEAYDLTVVTLRAVGQMITGKRGGDEVGGIIRIAEMSGDVSKTGGLIAFIYFMAILSVNLGLINLLPIPLLDGGHVVIFLTEMIIRRELKPKVKDYIFKFGLLIICAIMLLATWNDIRHLITRIFD